MLGGGKEFGGIARKMGGQVILFKDGGYTGAKFGCAQGKHSHGDTFAVQVPALAFHGVTNGMPEIEHLAQPRLFFIGLDYLTLALQGAVDDLLDGRLLGFESGKKVGIKGNGHLDDLRHARCHLTGIEGG